MVPVFESAKIPLHAQFILPAGSTSGDVLEQAATAMLDELLRLDGMRRPPRAGSVPAAGPGRPASSRLILRRA